MAKGSNCATLGYSEYVPATYATQGNWPLIIYLNGNGQAGNGNASEIQLIDDDGLPKQIATNAWDPSKRFVVLAPQMNWQTRTAADLNTFIQFAKANYKVDPNRIYLTGISGGGGPFFSYLEAYSGGDIAAAVPIDTLYSFSAAPAPCMWKSVPTWLFFGENDPTAQVFSHATSPYNGLKACSPAPAVSPRLTVYTNVGHDGWTRTYSLTGMSNSVVTGRDPYNMSVYDWMLQYTKADPVVASSSSSKTSSSVSSSSVVTSSSSSSKTSSSSSSVVATSSSSSSSSSLALTKLDPEFGALTLVDSIDPTAPGNRDTQVEPAGTTATQTILGRNSLVLKPQNLLGSMVASYAAFNMGKNKGLVAGGTYVLEFDYPDDVPRHIVFLNRGADLIRTVATGKEFGDYREQYAFPNPESLLYPQSASWKTYRFFFTLHDRFQPLAAVRNEENTRRTTGPADGFWVAVGHYNPKGNPINEGAAVGEIRLYSVNSPSAANLTINYPPNNLPHRRTFWREEMNDSTAMCQKANVEASTDPNSAAYANSCNPATGTSSGTTSSTWLNYKMKLAKVLGINVFTKDLLEFGYNQGFDITRNGGSSWFYPARVSYWDSITATANSYGLEVLPYFEYYGSMGAGTPTTTSCPSVNAAGDNFCQTNFNHRYACQNIGSTNSPNNKCVLRSYGAQQNCEPLLRNARNYTGFAWAETGCVDVSDPEALVDAKKLLNASILDIKGNANFAGAWFRTRVGSWPVSFKDQARARYAADRGIATPSKSDLRQSPTMRQDYFNWWSDKRRNFLIALRDYLRNGKNGNDGIANASVLFTSYHEEGLPVSGDNYSDAKLITDNISPWSAINSDSRWQYRYSAVSNTEWLNNKRYEKMLSYVALPPETIFLNGTSEDWRNDSLGYATPPADPSRYTSDEGINMTFPMGKQFTVDDTALINKFANASGGIAMAHHFPLNEDDGTGNFTADSANGSYNNWPMSGHFGYFVSDVERNAPFTMLTEVRGMANSDPFWIAYLSSNSFNTGAPQDLRRFNAAYLAWPALASAKVPSASTDADVIVRDMVTPSGKFVAVFNVGMTAKTNVQINITATRMGAVSSVQDRTSLQNLPVTSGKLMLDLQVADFKVFYVP